MRRTITVQPVLLVGLRLLAPPYVGVFPALNRERLLILAARQAGVGRILLYSIRRHRLVISSHIFGAETFGYADPDQRGRPAELFSLAKPEHAQALRAGVARPSSIRASIKEQPGPFRRDAAGSESCKSGREPAFRLRALRFSVGPDGV